MAHTEILAVGRCVKQARRGRLTRPASDVPLFLLSLFIIGEREESLRGVGCGVVSVGHLSIRNPAIGLFAFLHAPPNVLSLVTLNPVRKHGERRPETDAFATSDCFA